MLEQAHLSSQEVFRLDSEHVMISATLHILNILYPADGSSLGFSALVSERNPEERHVA